MMAITFGMYEGINTVYLSGYSRRGVVSSHPGGALFVMADGSTDFIRETITNTASTTAIDSPAEALVGIADGQVFDR
jgi:hypothetical protein